MSRNGNGTYNLPAGNPVVTGTTISSTWANNTLADMANAITGSIAADGQTPITGGLKGTNGTVTFAGVGQTKIPSGTTAQRAASPTDGMIRYNTDLKQYEGYRNGSWSIFGNGAGGTLFSDTVTATQGQTVITMPTGYVLGGDNLSVYVNGSRQIYNVNYTETTTDSFTFTTGLNAGDLVNYTIGASTSLSVNATSVLYNEGSTGAVDTNVQAKLQQTVSVKDFGAVGDGVTDDTAAIQSAINSTSSFGSQLFFPAGEYLVTNTINIPAYTNLKGEYSYQGYNDTTNDTSTKIKFNPSTAKSLFVASGAPIGGFRTNYCIDSIFIEGNSVTPTDNSVYAIDANLIIYSSFKNLKIWGFQTGIKCTQTINNRFENIEIGYSTVCCVFYQGGTCTTDVWEQCTFNLSPIGIDTDETSSTIRFNNCLFESLTTYAVNLVKECYGWSFTNCYAENVPSSNATSGVIFRVGYDGTNVAVSSSLSIIGGTYFGNNTYTSTTGTWLDVDYSYNVKIIGSHVQNIATVIKTTTNTEDNAIYITGNTLQAVNAFYSGTAGKIQGLYSPYELNNGDGNLQISRVRDAFAESIFSPTSTLSLGDGSANIVLGESASAIRPKVGASEDLGTSTSYRWNNIYLVNAPNVSSDANFKTIIGSLNNSEKSVAIKIKSLFKTFKYNASIVEKGDNARIHIGVIAQEIRDAFLSEGLDPTKYSLFCSDKFEDGTVMLSIRYEELLAFVISAI